MKKEASKSEQRKENLKLDIIFMVITQVLVWIPTFVFMFITEEAGMAFLPVVLFMIYPIGSLLLGRWAGLRKISWVETLLIVALSFTLMIILILYPSMYSNLAVYMVFCALGRWSGQATLKRRAKKPQSKDTGRVARPAVREENPIIERFKKRHGGK